MISISATSVSFQALEHFSKPVDSHNLYFGKLYFFKDIEATVFRHDIFCTCNDSTIHKLVVVGIGCDQAKHSFREKCYLVAAENVAGVNLVLYVIEGGGVAVGDDGGGLVLEGGEVVHYLAAEEGAAVGERRLVDYYVGALGFDALHDTLDCRLAEVVAVRLHRQAVNTDCHRRLLGCIARYRCPV